ncbi:MAG: O-antigen ligase family protein [Pyrinomonadaceae bacterium]
MFIKASQFDYKNPVFLFCAGWCLALMSGWLPIKHNLQTFIHMWQIETFVSVFFIIVLSYLLYSQRDKFLALSLSRQELNFIVFPMLAFIIWSALSISWSPSSKSALYHTLIWSEYLIFYLIARQILTAQSGYKSLLSLLTITILTVIVPAIFEYGSFMVFGGSTSIGMRYSKYGELVNTIFPLILIGVLRLKRRKFIAGLILIPVIGMFILATLSRANIMLFIGGMIIMTGVIFTVRRFRQYRRKMALIILAIIILPLPFQFITFFSEKPNVPIIERVKDSDGITASNDFRKLTTLISLEMFETHPFVGIGADNFGLRFNEYRAIYSAKNPTDANLKTAENEIAGRSHDEYLQILAELGAIGGMIFLWFLCGIGLMFLNAAKRFRRISPLPIAALVGIALFLANSLVSSFSFRLVQNGFVFFFVLAVAAKSLLKSNLAEKSADKIIVPANRLKFGYALGIAACLLLAAQCLARVSSVYFSNEAQRQTNIETALPFYQTSFWLDPENPAPRYAYGMNLFKAGRFSEAVPQFQESAKLGYAGSTDLSYLATAQTLAGDSKGAEQTFAYAAKIYPFSSFVRARYASILKAEDKTDESDRQLKYALELNEKQAQTWWTLIDEGSRAASQKAFQDKNRAELSDLIPAGSVYAVLAEREIIHPEEKAELNLDNLGLPQNAETRTQ